MFKTLNNYKQSNLVSTLFVGKNKLAFNGLKQILGNISDDIVLSYSEDVSENSILDKLEFFDVLIFENFSEKESVLLTKINNSHHHIQTILLNEDPKVSFQTQALFNLILNIVDAEKVIKDQLENLFLNISNPIRLKKIREDKDISKLFKKLSNREFEIARLMIKGYGNLEITNELNLKASTVSTFKSRIFHKLNIFNVIQLANKFDEYQYSMCL